MKNKLQKIKFSFKLQSIYTYIQIVERKRLREYPAAFLSVGSESIEVAKEDESDSGQGLLLVLVLILVRHYQNRDG